jgi:hypothetical protein
LLTLTEETNKMTEDERTLSKKELRFLQRSKGDVFMLSGKAT